jgi:hypothetical protein
MPLGSFEREVLRLIASNRNPESFVGGATVLHRSQTSPRTSKDIDVFHDTAESILDAVAKDTATLRTNGYSLEIRNPQPTFQRGFVRKGNQQTKIEWVYDSAFRFFPVETDADLGYRLNFWDAATNKILALAGRNELRDYMDVIWLHENHLQLGGLVWAASGKDAGLTPHFILEEAQRNSRFAAAEVANLELAKPVNLVDLKGRWLAALSAGRELIGRLPPEELGCLYLDERATPCTPNPAEPAFKKLTRHFGSVKGAWPRIVEN